VGLDFLTRDAHATFWSRQDFLWAVRCHLHLIADRAGDKLTFDMQDDVARRMQCRDSRGRRALEIFMQDYFRHATRVGELTRVFLAALESRHLYRAPFSRFLRRRRRLREGFRELNGRLTISDPDLFQRDPLNILRLFEEAVRT